MYNTINNCRVCKNNDIKMILNLHKQPLANTYLKNKDEYNEKYPLSLMLCDKCFHCQLSIVVDPDILFSNYLYRSNTSQTGKNHFKWFAINSINDCGITANKMVLDIACNDGTQLDYYKQLGWNTYGVDPATNLCHIGRNNGHNIINDYWSCELANDLVTKYSTFDIIIAQNVFAHVDDIYGFLDACRIVMNDNSVLYIQTSQADMILNYQFDTIYHEHLSFFSIESMIYLLNECNMKLIDIILKPIHGGSYIFKISSNLSANVNTNNIIKCIESEAQKYNITTYSKFSATCKHIMRIMRKVLEDYRSQDYKIIGFGSAAKGNVMINASKLNFDYIVDENELKVGLYTGSGTLIESVNKLYNENDKKVLIVILAWNFFDEIFNKIKEKRSGKGDHIITYFPKYQFKCLD